MSETSPTSSREQLGHEPEGPRAVRARADPFERRRRQLRAARIPRRPRARPGHRRVRSTSAIPNEPEGNLSQPLQRAGRARDLRRSRPRARPPGADPARQAGARGRREPERQCRRRRGRGADRRALLDGGLDAARALHPSSLGRRTSTSQRARARSIPSRRSRNWPPAKGCKAPAYEVVAPHRRRTTRRSFTVRSRSRSSAKRRRGLEQAGSRNRRRRGAAGAAAMTEATRAGFVAVIGAPNAGKSTLVNALVGQKVAIVSPKAQTTRARLMGIAIDGRGADPAGRHAGHLRAASAGSTGRWSPPPGAAPQDADLILLVIDAAAGVDARRRARSSTALERARSSRCSSSSTRSIWSRRTSCSRSSAELTDAAQSRRGVHDQRRAPATASPTSRRRSPTPMPEGPWHFPEDEVSDATDRMIAAELTREQIVNQLHAGAALCDRGRDREMGGPPGRLDRDPPADPGRARQPEGDRHRQGRRAAQGDRRRPRARRSPQHLGRPVHLFLHVKVNPHWDEDRGLYREIGLEWAD